MTTNLWPARGARLQAIAAAMKPSWARKCSAISYRLVKPDCHRCGGEDHMHSVECAKPRTYGNSTVRFHNAVAAAATKHFGKPRCLECDAELGTCHFGFCSYFGEGAGAVVE